MAYTSMLGEITLGSAPLFRSVKVAKSLAKSPLFGTFKICFYRKKRKKSAKIYERKLAKKLILNSNFYKKKTVENRKN